MRDSAEHSIDRADLPDRAAQVARQDDFLPLVRALTRAEGFALYFAECDAPTFGRKVADVVRARLDRPVIDVELGDVDRRPTRPSIDYVLEKQLAGAAEDAAVFVWNLERLLPSTKVDRDVTEQTLTEVNWRRSAFTRLERPLVIWLPEYAIRYLARNAPDFFDWNSGLYRFHTPEDQRAALLGESLQQMEGMLEMGSLPVTEKRKTEAYLKSLLDEYTRNTEFDLRIRSSLLNGLTMLYISRNSYESARNQSENALQTWRKIGDRSGEAATLHQLATIALHQGAYDQAKKQFEASLEIKKEISDQASEAATLHQLATIALHQGKFERARQQFEDVLQVRQEIGDRDGRAATLHNLATIAFGEGQYNRASTELQKVLAIRQDIGDRSGEAATRHGLASVARVQGEYDKATTEFQKVLKIVQDTGDRSGEEATWHQLGMLAADSFGRKRKELRLFLISHWILTDIGTAHSEQTEISINTLATELEYDQANLKEEYRSAVSSYQKDRGWSLLREAFPDADFPDDVPSAEGGEEDGPEEA